MKKLLALAVTALAVTACAAPTDTAVSTAPPVSCGGTGASLTVAKASNGAADLLTAGKPFPAGDLLLAAGSTGELLVESGRHFTPATESAPAKLRPGTLSVLDPATGRTQEVRGKGDLQPGTQTVFGDLDREHVVWQQMKGTTLSESDWAIYAADRATGVITQLATAKPVDDKGLKPTVPGYTIPRIHEGTTYWAEAQAAATAGTPPTVGIYARALDGSAPAKQVVPNAILPAVSGQWLYYADFDGAKSDRPGYAIHRLSLRTGATETVQRAETEPGSQFLAADGDTVAWALADGTVKVRTANEKLVTIAAEGEHLSWLSAGQGLVGFGDGGGEARRLVRARRTAQLPARPRRQGRQRRDRRPDRGLDLRDGRRQAPVAGRLAPAPHVRLSPPELDQPHGCDVSTGRSTCVDWPSVRVKVSPGVPW